MEVPNEPRRQGIKTKAAAVANLADGPTSMETVMRSARFDQKSRQVSHKMKFTQ